MNIEETSFGIISYAGDAFANLRTAIQAARRKDYDTSASLMKEAQASILEAQRINKVLMDIPNINNQLSLLVIHAQDTLMNTVMFESIAEELIEGYKERE